MDEVNLVVQGFQGGSIQPLRKSLNPVPIQLIHVCLVPLLLESISTTSYHNQVLSTPAAMHPFF